MDVELSPVARQQFQQLPLTMQARVDDVLVRLADWPHVSGVKWPTGNWKHYARLRTGDWRVVFHLASDDLLVVDRIVHRRDAYAE